jgi:hypothetical protein
MYYDSLVGQDAFKRCEGKEVVTRQEYAYQLLDLMTAIQ